METKKKNIQSLIGSAHDQFKIPYFQRSYVWNKVNWNSWIESLNDLMIYKKENSNHSNTFIGSVILKIAKRAEQGRSNKFLIIDGQQRFTTILIFLKACVDINNALKDRFTNYSHCDDDGTKNALKLKNSHLDKEAFIQILNAKSPLDIQNDLNDIMPFILGERKSRKKYSKPHPIVQAYWFFWNKIQSGKLTEDSQEQTPEELAKSLFFYTTENLELISLELDEYEDEQKIFDTINSLGVHLTTAEICKNEIFSKIDGTNTNKEELYTDTWKKVFESDTSTFWNQQIIIGRLSRSHLDSFLYAFLLIENPPENNYIKQEDLLNEYKKILRTKNSDEIKKLLFKISEYANTYYYLFNNKESLQFKDYSTRLMILINKLDVKTLYPLVLFIGNKMNATDSENTNKDLEVLFKYIECFIVRRFLAQEDEKSYNKLFTSWIKILKTKPSEEWTSELKHLILDKQRQKSSSRKYPNNIAIKEIINSTYRSKHKSLAGILFVIEAYRRRHEDKQTFSEIPLFNNISLEHIIPRAWKENWSDVITEESEDTIYTLGNFSLVKKSLNSSMSNLDWTYTTNKQGKLKKLEEFSHDSKINKDILIEKKPSIQSIQTRTQYFINDIIDIWSF